MSYCTSCLDGPVDTRFVVLQWGTRVLDSNGQPIADPPAGAEQSAGAQSESAPDHLPSSTPEPILVSGGGRNEDRLAGHPAILDVPTGKGRIIAFNFNPLHRDLNRSDYRFLWNAILNWSALPPAPP
jgi:hypothetical protein